MKAPPTCCTALIIVWTVTAFSQAQPATSTPTVVAHVNDHRLLSAEVDQILQSLPPDQRGREKAHALATEIAIQRALALEYLEARSLGAAAQEIDANYERWKKMQAARGRTAGEYFEQSGMNEEAVRRAIAWSVGWPRYRVRHLDRESLQNYFDEHHREFDGTRLRVAHLLLQPAEGEIDLMARAADIRQQIETGQISFVEATARHSRGATAKAGGELGWITAHGPMGREFTSAALVLNESDISPPVRSPFGVHLIRCLEVEAGTKRFEDVVEEVKRSAEARLFQAIADKQRRTAKVVLPSEQGSF